MSSPLKQTKNYLLLIGIIFVAFNLRPAITSVGPLVNSIRFDTGISNGVAGLLTTIPLIAFGLVSPFAPQLAKKIGNELSVFIGLLILGIGILLRSSGLFVTLFIGTALAGVGIAVCNVLIPGIVKKSFPNQVGLTTGIYTFSMAFWAGMAPGLSIPLSESLQLGWRMSLGVWAVLLMVAIFFWVPQLTGNKRQNQEKAIPQPRRSDSIWSSGIAWQVTFFMGLQSMVYFSMTAWLPEILQSRGLSVSTSGWMVALMQFSGLPANFMIPVLADRLPNQKGIAWGIGSCSLVGILGLLVGGNTIALIVSIILLGIALGAAISHSLTLISLRAADPIQASDLSGMAQSIGYLLAAVGPFSLGFLFDLFHSWTLPLIMLALVSILFTIAGIGAGRNKHVFDSGRSHHKDASSTMA
ncbi:MFS transporter [Mesobacillus foraminis]|uniref:CynX/NimT family MFS transporter n=1 Tax=Mesobacillus foraminis TaxID=279826 RepID=UPI00399FE3E3